MQDSLGALLKKLKITPAGERLIRAQGIDEARLPAFFMQAENRQALRTLGFLLGDMDRLVAHFASTAAPSGGAGPSPGQ